MGVGFIREQHREGVGRVSPLMRRVLRPVVRVWGTYAREAAVLRPSDTPRVHAPGIGLDRILVVGSGSAVGWGVLSHELALPGALARALAARTGRGVDVDAIADPELTARTTVAALDGVRTSGYDAFVVSLGLNEALALESPQAYSRALREVVDAIRAGASTRSRIFLLGVPPVRSFEVYDAVLGSVAARHAHRLNKAALELSRVTPGVTFVPLALSAPTRGQYLDRAAYARWGDGIAESIAPLMFLDRVARPGESRTPLDEERRQAAIDALGVAEGPDDRFARIVTLAARLLGAEAAAFSIVEHDHVWFKAAAGAASGTTPREDAFCSTTILSRAGLIVGDARVDARFSSSSLVTPPDGVRFYAGYPVLSPLGVPVGALCVFDSHPRSSEDVDLALLRRLASMVELELASAPVARRRTRR